LASSEKQKIQIVEIANKNEKMGGKKNNTIARPIFVPVDPNPLKIVHNLSKKMKKRVEVPVVEKLEDIYI
jgi:hypothetical protein